MQDMLDIFVEMKYTEERRDLFYRAFGLFAVFTYIEPHGEVVDLISLEGNMEESDIVDGVSRIIENGVDKLLTANRVKMNTEASFKDRIDILEGIFSISKIDDPTPYLPLFDGWLSNEEILAKVIGLSRQTAYEDYFVAIAWVYDGTISNLKTYFEEMKIENETIEFSVLKDIRTSVHAFNRAFGTIPVVDSLIEMNLLKGQVFETYLNLFRDEIIDPTDMSSTVYALLWLAIISSDGCKDPTFLLTEESDNLFADHKDQNLFKSMLTKALGHYLPTRNALNEKA